MIVTIITILEQALLLIILVKVIISYFMDPFHPFRRAVDQIVDPMLQPIRNIIPTVGRIDFSPIILMILVQIAAYILRTILL